MKRKVIIVSDGDQIAKKAVEHVAHFVGGRCISSSAGNPTPLNGKKIAEMIFSTPHDPVLVMIDDKGECGKGKGENALEYLIHHPLIEILGLVAVASNSNCKEKIEVDYSIDSTGRVISGSVNKDGVPVYVGLSGDAIELLKFKEVPVVIGTGDTGKMNGTDSENIGNPITLKAVKEILIRSGYIVGES